MPLGRFIYLFASLLLSKVIGFLRLRPRLKTTSKITVTSPRPTRSLVNGWNFRGTLHCSVKELEPFEVLEGREEVTTPVGPEQWVTCVLRSRDTQPVGTCKVGVTEPVPFQTRTRFRRSVGGGVPRCPLSSSVSEHGRARVNTVSICPDLS